VDSKFEKQLTPAGSQTHAVFSEDVPNPGKVYTYPAAAHLRAVPLSHGGSLNPDSLLAKSCDSSSTFSRHLSSRFCHLKSLKLRAGHTRHHAKDKYQLLEEKDKRKKRFVHIENKETRWSQPAHLANDPARTKVRAKESSAKRPLPASGKSGKRTGIRLGWG
jgi:hypothetical protein